MDPYLFSQLTIFSSRTTPDDGQKDGQAHQVSQLSLSDMSTQPPGAGIMPPTTSDHSRQAYNPPLRPPTAPYFSVPRPSHSSSPEPRPSHVSKTRHSFIRRS